jgi:hypothetical protein
MWGEPAAFFFPWSFVMNIGIIGLPQTGKKTLFKLLVGSGALDHQSDPGRTARGVAEIQDPRFDELVHIYEPRKQTRARMDMLLPPKIEEHAVSEADIFRDLAEVEVFCHVVRAFEDDAVYHVSGSVDPLRDIRPDEEERPGGEQSQRTTAAVEGAPRGGAPAPYRRHQPR